MRRNDEVASRLEEYADLLAAQDVEYKPRTYRRAAENVRDHPRAIEDLVDEGQAAVEEIDGVGEAIAEKIVEYVETGAIEELEEERETLPVDMAELTSVEGVGPRTVGQLYEALGVRTLDDLERAAEAGDIREVSGFGETSEANIREGIAFARQAHERELLGEALPLGESIREYLSGQDAVGRCELAGSLRRWKATIGDVDVLAEAVDASADAPEGDRDDAGEATLRVDEDAFEAVLEAFTDWPAADEVIEAGTNKASVRTDGVRVDLRVVVPAEFGSALQYFTGSKEHNIRFRNRAIERDLKVNEYGVFDVGGVEDPDAGQRVGRRVAGETEEGMYAALDLPWIAPELREDRGEIDAAATGELPDLLEAEEIRGDLHVHTDWSDGRYSIEEMIEGAAEFGHDYVCISDHAAGPGVVGGVGLSDEELREQIEVVREVGDDAPIEVFAGVEANVGSEGSVDVAEDVLEDLDVVVASPHSALDGDGTDRLVAAVSNPLVDVLGHPTGRLLHQRPGLDFDTARVARAAADHDTALEVNGNPDRLDLDGGRVKTAVEAGATVAVNTDAHGPGSYGLVRYGVHTARRGWAEADDVLNARDAEGVREFCD